MKLDLHIHTTFSDGDRTPSEVVRIAIQNGLDGIAITDHDECRGYGEAAGCKELMVLPGIELSAIFEGEVHVLGLNIDWQDTVLLGHVEKAAKARQQRAQRMLDKLKSADINITMDEVLSECEGDVLGRPHFASALVKKGYASSHKEAFSRYLANHAPFYIPLEKVDVRRAAELIIGAGGKAVLAHPGLLKPGVFERIVPRLCDMGFWGIEAYHPAHTRRQCIEYEQTAKKNGLFVTAGSDFHGSVKPKLHIGQENRGGRYLAKSQKALCIQ